MEKSCREQKRTASWKSYKILAKMGCEVSDEAEKKQFLVFVLN